MTAAALLALLADPAYRPALSTDEPAERAYAAGVQDLARHLVGEVTSQPLQQLLSAARRAETRRLELERQAARRAAYRLLATGSGLRCSWCDADGPTEPVVTRRGSAGEQLDRSVPTGDRVCRDCRVAGRFALRPEVFRALRRGEFCPDCYATSADGQHREFCRTPEVELVPARVQALPLALDDERGREAGRCAT
jgi:hypothetical protein